LIKAGKIIYNFEAPSPILSQRNPLSQGERVRVREKWTFMQAFELAQLVSQQRSSDKLYLEFLRVPDLSMGLYVLSANGTDPQSPHTEDEVYYVISGKAKIRVGEDDRDVQAGSIVYVAKHVEHRFHSIEEELKLLVFFAPAEYSLKV
jgi:mannose-6-phosphate isomerase-like protein (cupin superfamily)